MKQEEGVRISRVLRIGNDYFLKFVNRSFLRPVPFEGIEYIKDLEDDTLEVVVKSKKSMEAFGVRYLTIEEMRGLKMMKLIDIGSRMKQSNLIFICRENVFKCKSPVTNVKVQINNKEVQICVIELLKDMALAMKVMV